jgi:starch phosphorylase
MGDLFTRYVLPQWQEAGRDRWERLADASDDEVWRAREQGREQLVAFVRQRLRSQLRARGLSASDVEWTDSVLDPKALTIGFARRFATYKRATLLLSQPERLKALLLSTNHPVQLVFSGKSHPADESGKELIRQITTFAADPEVRHRVAFVADYDIAVARTLLQGADVWLNNPRRPQEACGTSGMKAALNGGLNLSILDGWWDECFDGENGWAISSAEDIEDLERRDEVEAGSLFDLLERQIVPLFYDRFQGPVPRQWVGRVKRSLITLGPFVTATRMVGDYTEQLYEPAAAQADAMTADQRKRARELAAWKAATRAGWEGVRVDHVDIDDAVAEIGSQRTVQAVVTLGALSPADVEVQLIHGPSGQGDELTATTVEAMEPVEGSGRQMTYRGSFPCERAGRYGVTVRVVPHHADLVSPAELGRIAWA